MMTSGRSFRKFVSPLLVLCGFVSHAAWAQKAEDEKKPDPATKSSAAVGMVGKVNQIVIPGGELEVVPTTDTMARIIVRIAETYRHGDAFRYDLEYTGFEPGKYDLVKSLKRKAPEESMDNVPPIEIEITSTLEPGKIEPTRPESPSIRSWMTYWAKLNIIVGLWIAGLIVLWQRRRDEAAAANQAVIPPQTVAQRLKPLVQAACDGTIEPHKRAELESLLIAYWTDRLQLDENVPTGRILSTLKENGESAPLLSKLEEWLHMPPGQGRISESEISELLTPYETVAEPRGSELEIGKGAI